MIMVMFQRLKVINLDSRIMREGGSAGMAVSSVRKRDGPAPISGESKRIIITMMIDYY